MQQSKHLPKLLKILILFGVLVLTSCGNNQSQLIPLPKNAVILSFGDSLTYGTGATQDTSYPSELAKITGFKVINSGVPGEQTREALARIDHDLNAYRPQLVILCLGGNDFLHGVPHDKIRENLGMIIHKIQNAGAQVVLIGVPEPSLSLKVPSFYAELGQIFFVPVDTHILSKLMKTPAYKSDYIHLNQQGYEVFAEDVANFLKKSGAM